MLIETVVKGLAELKVIALIELIHSKLALLSLSTHALLSRWVKSILKNHSITLVKSTVAQEKLKPLVNSLEGQGKCVNPLIRLRGKIDMVLATRRAENTSNVAVHSVFQDTDTTNENELVLPEMDEEGKRE